MQPGRAGGGRVSATAPPGATRCRAMRRGSPASTFYGKSARRGRGHGPLRQLRQRRVPGLDPPVEDAAAPNAATTGATSASTTRSGRRAWTEIRGRVGSDPTTRARASTLRRSSHRRRRSSGRDREGAARRGFRRRLSAFLFRHPRFKLGLSLGAPLTWLLVVYIGSLLFLLGERVLERRRPDVADRARGSRSATSRPCGRTASTGRSRSGRSGSPPRSRSPTSCSRSRSRTTPPAWPRRAPGTRCWSRSWSRCGRTTWSGVFAWKIMLTPNGFVDWLAELTGLGHAPARELELGGRGSRSSTCGCRSRSCPIYAALERVPGSFLEASIDLGGEGLDRRSAA